ncbi:MAG: hypothetical protein BAJALOKI3v1_250024 [Promethearchaeota archaeon]|nr:MAG: hypothetical protein BAJALOKI3v1_250024 [Candidatus Lokiarchaeota archaeon]
MRNTFDNLPKKSDHKLIEFKIMYYYLLGSYRNLFPNYSIGLKTIYTKSP